MAKKGLNEEITNFRLLPPVKIWTSIPGYRYMKFPKEIKYLLDIVPETKLFEYVLKGETKFYQIEVKRDECSRLTKILKKNKIHYEIEESDDSATITQP